MSNDSHAKELAEAHWKYIESLLLTHGESLDTVSKIGFHYTTAMIHGYKHGYCDFARGDQR